MSTILEDLKNTHTYWQQEIARKKDVRSGIVFGYRHDQPAFTSWELQVCEAFLKMNEDERNRLRDVICDEDVIWHFNGFPLLISKQISSSHDRHAAMLGLAALLVVDGRVEQRETDHSLSRLSEACNRASISLKELIREASTIAVSETTRRWLVDWAAEM